jgi:hypothetical protein
MGNRAFAAMLQREVTRDPPGSWVTQGARDRAAAHQRIAVAKRRLRDLEHVAEDIIGDDLGLTLRPAPADPDKPPTAETNGRTRPLEERLREAAAGKDAKKAEEASRLLRERQVNKRWINKRLREIADGGGANAEHARRLIGDLREAEKEHGAAKRVLKPKQPGAGAANTPRPTKYQGGDAAPKAEGKVEKTAGSAGKVETAAAKVEKTVGSKVATEAVEEVARPRRLAGLGAKVGKATLALIDGLMPDPTDAIALLIDYAESFKAAQEAVRKRNLEKGFAIGWACYVLFPTWERAKTFARTYVEKDVITQIIDAVGIAENAYNEGLVRGFRYGEKHSTAQLDRVRQRALDAVHRSGLTVNGNNFGDGVYQFVRDDVYLFAGALQKATREVLADTERRKEAREERERLEREARKAREDFDAGNAPAGVREW